MSRYTFIMQHSDGARITHEGNQVHLWSVIDDFELFLRGAGFVFDGHLDIVNPDEHTAAQDTDDLGMCCGQPGLFDDAGIWLSSHHAADTIVASGLDDVVVELYNHHDDDDTPEVQHGTA